MGVEDTLRSHLVSTLRTLAINDLTIVILCEFFSQVHMGT